MEQKIIFRELLGEILKAARENGGRLSTEQVDAFFADARLNQDQMKLIYDYLVERHVRVDGYVRSKEETPGDVSEGHPAETVSSGSRVLELYLEEIHSLPELDTAEEFRLFDRAALGDAEAKQRLVQAYLPVVCDLAAEYEQEKLPSEDLIQEGNLALLLALDHLEKADSLAACQARLINEIHAGMVKALQEADAEAEKDQSMVSRVSSMEEKIRNLTQELSRDISAEELSAYLDLPLEEILNILALAGDEMKK